MVTTRSLTPDDARAYCELRRGSLLDSPWAFLGAPGDDGGSDEDVVRERLSNPNQRTIGGWLEPEGGLLAGVATCIRSQRTKTAHRAEIVSVYTAPQARGRGLGSAVLGAAIEMCRSWSGIEIVTLSTSVRSEAAMRLYERFGFERWGLEPDCVRVDGISYDEVHYALRLRDASARPWSGTVGESEDDVCDV